MAVISNIITSKTFTTVCSDRIEFNSCVIDDHWSWRVSTGGVGKIRSSGVKKTYMYTNLYTLSVLHEKYHRVQKIIMKSRYVAMSWKHRETQGIRSQKDSTSSSDDLFVNIPSNWNHFINDRRFRNDTVESLEP